MAGFGVFIFLATTGWMLYKFNVMHMVRKGQREQAIVEETALATMTCNAAVIVSLYYLSCVCFLQYSLLKLPDTHEQYLARLHTAEFLTGMCVASIAIAFSSRLLLGVVMTQLKQRVRERSWQMKFLRGRQKTRISTLVKND